MDKIQPKQIEGVVDTSTQQSIGGEKTFNSPVNFQPPLLEKGVYVIRIEGMWIYWVQDLTNLDQDNNYRLGIGTERRLVTEVCKGGAWEIYPI